MAIVFNAPQDRFGIQSAGSALAQALMQNAADRNQLNSTLQRDLFLDQLQTQRDLRGQEALLGKEQRQLALRQQFGTLLGDALSVAYDMNSTPEQKNAALSGYIQAGGDIKDVQQAYKALNQQNETTSLLSQLGIQPQGVNPQAISQNQNMQLQQQQQIAPGSIDINTQASVQGNNFYDSIDENTALTLSASPNPQLAAIGKAAVESKKLQQSRFDSDRKFQSKQSESYVKEISGIRQSLRNKEFALRNLDAALAQGNTGALLIDNISRIFGRPELLSQSGAQQLGATKELLVSNIGRVGARPNQWIEQQIASALPDLGKSLIANQTLAEGIRGEIELGRARVEIFDRLAEQDRAQKGAVQGDIDSRVDKELAPVAKQIEDRAAYKIRELFEQEKGATYLRDNLMKKVPEGTPLTKNMYIILKQKYGNGPQAIDNAKKLGYTVYTSETVGGS